MIKNTNPVNKFIRIYRNLQVLVSEVQNNDGFCTKHVTQDKLRDSQNYMPPIITPFSAKRIATQILVIVKLN